MSLWINGSVKVDVTEDGDAGLKFKKVFARLLIPFAVHASLVREGYWILTHVHTGLIIVPVKSEAAAMKIGEYLRLNCVRPFREKTKPEVLALMPTWVNPWLKACQEAGDYLEPSSCPVSR